MFTFTPNNTYRYTFSVDYDTYVQFEENIITLIVIKVTTVLYLSLSIKVR